MVSGTNACNSSGAALGFVTSAITNLDSPLAFVVIVLRVVAVLAFDLAGWG